MIKLDEEIKKGTRERSLDMSDWVRLRVTHCQAMQSVLTFTCSPECYGRSVKFERFRQPWGVEAAACREAAGTGLLKVGMIEHAVVMNMTRSHMGGDEDCSKVYEYRVKILDRKVTQILMEIFVKKEWIWWNEAARMVTTSSDKAALVHENGHVATEDGLYVWEMPTRTGEVEPPAAGKGSGLLS
jgi:hypothetical protein